MDFVKTGVNINFVGKRNIVILISLCLFLVSFFSIFFYKGINYGIDFSGGILLHIRFDSDITSNNIRSCLKWNKLEISNIQQFGSIQDNEFIIKTNDTSNKKFFMKKVNSALKSIGKGKIEVRRVEIVGPRIGAFLQERALLAIFYTLLLVTVYISGRFEAKWFLGLVNAIFFVIIVHVLSLLEIPIYILIACSLFLIVVIFFVIDLSYAMGAITALVHDVFIVVGFFSILEKEFTLSIVAALMITVGYSLNDTIIVFDRIRENLVKFPDDKFHDNINKSINETLNRTLLTSITTLIVICCMLVFGGQIINDFAFALMIGVLAGTYSSIYVASPILIIFRKV